MNKIQNYACGLAVGLAALGIADSAMGQVSSLDLQSPANVAALTPGSVVSNTFTLTRDCDLAIDGRFFTTNSSALVSVAGSFSVDSTNFGLMPFTLSGTATSNGVPGQVVLTPSNAIALPTLWTNFNHSVIAGFTAVALYVTNGPSLNTTTNTFGSLKLNRPTINTATY